jgi:hypothetical protein
MDFSMSTHTHTGMYFSTSISRWRTLFYAKHHRQNAHEIISLHDRLPCQEVGISRLTGNLPYRLYFPKAPVLNSDTTKVIVHEILNISHFRTFNLSTWVYYSWRFTYKERDICFSYFQITQRIRSSNVFTQSVTVSSLDFFTHSQTHSQKCVVFYLHTYLKNVMLCKATQTANITWNSYMPDYWATK